RRHDNLVARLAAELKPDYQGYYGQLILSSSNLDEMGDLKDIRHAARVGESTALAVLSDSGEEIQYTARAAAGRVLTAHVPVGTRLPAHATALGRVLLPHPEARTQGYALVDEELEAGLRAIAAPVRDRTGTVVAAVNVAMHTARRTREACESDILPELLHTASHIEADLRVAGRFILIPPT
ncbi:IclR family transcriptional regulator C-terminal domain-containing protein, partial [Streptomyces sp. A13(2022)]|uniref:IclR family transcriptional regulator domain-containing protein n=1 Tax=Streptomyces sp. A13(2022) TaxID=2964768 RepID=UPI0029534728